MSKYHARKTEYDGFVFDSKLECNRYIQLKFLEKEDVIRDLELQPKFPCVVNGKLITTYTADFRYFDVENNRTVVEDVKGVRTDAFVLRKKLTEALYEITIHEITKDMIG